ncbi:hypothetical protein D3C80_1274820 [compost metagenome]
MSGLIAWIFLLCQTMFLTKQLYLAEMRVLIQHVKLGLLLSSFQNLELLLQIMLKLTNLN